MSNGDEFEPVPANDGDTLCGIASQYGFPNCERLREVEANEPFRNRTLRSGDVVQVPVLERRNEDGREVEVRHEFQRRGIPAPTMRYVHGSRTRRCRSDRALTFLNISNYRSDRGGQNATNAFPNRFGFRRNGHADPDTFKIEVVDPGAQSDTVNVTLEAIKPVYAADGSIDYENVVYEQFAAGDPDADKRSVTITCQKISNRNRTRLRSRYLRLVVDDQDFAALSGDPIRTDGTAQGLLVSDMADGNDGANDNLEILDQRIRATYELRNCPATAGQQKCRVVAELPFEEGIRRRIKLCVHVFRESVGGSNAFNITEQDVRLRTKKWFRRTYAQINMAPKFVPCSEGGDEIEFLDPPPNNMITVSETHGRPVSAAGGPYQLTFELNLPAAEVAAAEAEAVAAGLTAADAQPTVTVNLTNGWTPQLVAGNVVTRVNALAGNIFRAQSFRNGREFTAANHSYDVRITRTDNRRLNIENEILTPGAGMTIHVARVRTAAVPNNVKGGYLEHELRHLIRSAPGTDDRLDFYICREFDAFAGLGLTVDSDLAAHFRKDSPLRWACFVMAGDGGPNNCMDGTDDRPWVYPHEAGHVIPDAFHIRNASPLRDPCLMRGTILNANHPVDASKRIFDNPTSVRIACNDPAQPTAGATTLARGSMAQRYRDRGGSVMENW